MIYSIPNGTINKLVVLCALGPVVYQAASVTIQHLRVGYNPFQDAISELAFGPFGWLQVAVFCLFGLSLVILGVTFSSKMRVKINIGAILLVLTGICFILLGINRAPGSDQVSTLAAMIHKNATLAVMVLFPLVCFTTAPVLKSRGYSMLSYYSVAVGAFSLLFFFLGGQFLAANQSAVGIYERVLLWNGQLWVEIVCAYFVINSLKERTPPKVPVITQL